MSRKRSVTCGALVVVVGASILTWFLRSPSAKSDVPCFPFDAVGYGLSVRYVEADGGDLLITQSAFPGAAPRYLVPTRVHRFDRHEGKLVSASETDWRNARGEIVNEVSCSAGNRISLGDWELGIFEGQFLVGPEGQRQQQATMVGTAALHSLTSHDQKLVAVETGSGSKAFSTPG